jgi:hypothetical protein
MAAVEVHLVFTDGRLAKSSARAFADFIGEAVRNPTSDLNLNGPAS